MAERIVSAEEQRKRFPATEVASRQQTSPENPRHRLAESPQDRSHQSETTLRVAPKSHSRVQIQTPISPPHSEEQSDTPAELDQAEAEVSDDRPLADPCPHDIPQPSGEQATSPESAYTYSEEARKALLQCYDLLLQLARQDDTPDDQPLKTGAGSNDPPDALRGDSDTQPQDVESGVKEAVNG
jgi:hypothetical protein